MLVKCSFVGGFKGICLMICNSESFMEEFFHISQFAAEFHADVGLLHLELIVCFFLLQQKFS